MTQAPDQLHAGYDGRRTLAALGLAILLLAAIEIGFRAVSTQFSGNLAHLQEFDQLLGQVANSTAGTTVFLGNSLTNNAIDPVVFARAATESSGRPMDSIKFVPDGTTLLDWQCVIDRLPPVPQGTQLVIGFAWQQLTDQQSVNVVRTFGLYCPLSRLPTVSQNHDISIGGWLEAGIAKLSLTYVLRERLRNAALTPIVPNYETAIQHLNDLSQVTPIPAAKSDRTLTYQALRAALKRARQQGYSVSVMAMPTMNPYELDSALPRILLEQHVLFHDLRNPPWLDPDLFRDPIHLNPAGAEIFTQSLANEIWSAKFQNGLASPLAPPNS